MGTATYASIVTGIIVAAVILGAGIFPFIDNLTAGETIEVSNEGASWIRMAYITDQSDYSAEYSLGDDGITVAGQTGEYGDMILYADSKNTLCIIDDQIVRITGNEYTIYGDDVTTFTVSRTNGVVSFDDYATSESVEWAYVPTEGGAYGSFAPDTLPLNRYNSALAAVGGFAGIYAYNENLTYDAGLVMDADVTNTVINSVKWALPTAEPEEPEPLDIDPLDIDPSTWQPIDIDPINPFQPEENQIMAVPTPTYTDGDWGYELFNVYIGSVLTQVAQIVSYSGAGGGAITIPTTVGGYQVWALGKSGGQNTIFGSGVSATDLTIPNFGHALMYVYPYAFADCSGFTGNLVINQPTIQNKLTNYGYTFQNSGFVTATLPSTWVDNDSYTGDTFKGCTRLTTVTFSSGTNISISSGSFDGCTSLTTIDLSNVSRIYRLAFSSCSGLTGVLEIPSSVKTIERSAFNRCTGLTGLKLNEGLESIINTSTSTNSGTFEGCTGMTGILVLPSTLTNIGNRAFYNTHFTSLIVKSNVTPSATAFTGTRISQVLDFSENEWTVTSYGLNAEEVRSDIEADSYLSVVHISESTTKEGAVFDVVNIIPLALVAGFLLIAVWVFIKK